MGTFLLYNLLSLFHNLAVRHVHRDQQRWWWFSSGHLIGRVCAVVDAEAGEVAPLLVATLIITHRIEVSLRDSHDPPGMVMDHNDERPDRKRRTVTLSCVTPAPLLAGPLPNSQAAELTRLQDETQQTLVGFREYLDTELEHEVAPEALDMHLQVEHVPLADRRVRLA